MGSSFQFRRETPRSPGESASRQHISNEQYTVAAVAADVANAEADVDADADAFGTAL